MSTQVQIRRGTTAQHSTFTGASAELTFDTDLKTVRAHDGTTAGGIVLAKASDVSTAVANLIDSAPGALDTLNELAAAINDDSNFAATIVTQLGNKANITSLTTANVAEVSNLYFTTSRVRESLTASGSINYNNTTGVISFTQGNTDTITEGSSNFYYTDARVYSAVTGNLALKANLTDKLNVFAATSSSELAGVISDETGSGALVFATTPTLVTPILGLATGTSVMLTANIGAAAGNVSGNFTAGNFQTTGTVKVGTSITVDGGVYGNVITTQYGSVYATGNNANPFSIMQVRSNDGTSGMGMKAYAGLNSTLYSSSGFTFTTGATVRDRDTPSGGTVRATLDATGLSVDGNVTSPFFYSQSDINLKKDIEPIVGALDIIKQLGGYSFKWKHNDSASIGLIAQYVEEVLPMLTGTSSDGSKTVLYNGIIAILLEAVKAQQVQIDEIKSKLNG